MTVYAIIPAAGLGVRFGANTKKQFLTLAGKTILLRTVETFLQAGIFKKIVVVLPQDEIDNTILPQNILVVSGGKTRAESVCNGFMALNTLDEDVVLVHDAVRPLVSINLIKKVSDEASIQGAVIPGIVLSDTIKQIKNSQVEVTLDRNQLMAVQTPQGFKAQLLKKAYGVYKDFDWTDEAMLMEKMHVPVTVVEGEKNNIKVTTPEDLTLANYYITTLSLS